MTKNEAIRQVFADQQQISSEWGDSSDPTDDWAREQLHALGITDEEIAEAFAETQGGPE